MFDARAWAKARNHADSNCSSDDGDRCSGAPEFDVHSDRLRSSGAGKRARAVSEQPVPDGLLDHDSHACFRSR
eukprot:6132083-Pyramimonas_sp.AAC.1